MQGDPVLGASPCSAASRLERPGGGNIDHLAVGPGGVFVLDTKVWSGVVTVSNAGATVSPRDDPSASWTATGQQHTLPTAAAAVGRALAAATGQALPSPHAIVVLWSPFPQRVAVSGKVTYVAGEHLADWLTGQPRQLRDDRIAASTERARWTSDCSSATSWPSELLHCLAPLRACGR